METLPLHIEVEHLGPESASRIPENYDGYTIDVGVNWNDMIALEGIMYTPSGLLLRKRGDIVALRAKLREESNGFTSRN